MSPPKPSDPTVPRQVSRLLRILVVEDNLVNRRFVEAILEDAGHAPVLAAGGRDALALLERETFDVVLMDVQMPEMDGFETTAAIRVRDESNGSRTPILAMTANAYPEDRERCLAAGMDGYIAKPLRYEELIELVESLASGDPEPRRAAAPQPVPGRAGVRQELAGHFVADAQRLHAEICEAIAQRDGGALQRAAHSLRGTAGFFKAQAVFDLARRLEDLGKAEDFGTRTERASQELGDELERLSASPSPVRVTPPPAR
jgi:CheY-like chemotaxis protein/HPt (histidine-containing phosphotransfer) domain-containing protein